MAPYNRNRLEKIFANVAVWSLNFSMPSYLCITEMFGFRQCGRGRHTCFVISNTGHNKSWDITYANDSKWCNFSPCEKFPVIR